MAGHTLKNADLWQRYKKQKDLEAREALILDYISLVKYVVGRLAISLPANVDKDDLFSYGIFGLLESIERFDPERGLKFETYALTRIKGAVWDGLRAMDWVPNSLRQKAKELEKAYVTLAQQFGREATDEEVAAFLGLTKKDFQKLVVDVQATSLMSLDEHWTTSNDKSNRGESFRLLDSLEDHQAEDPSFAMEVTERKEILAKAIDRLPEKERTVIALYYYEGLTLKEIGAVLSLSESRICQLHTKAILRLRGQLSRAKKKIF